MLLNNVRDLLIEGILSFTNKGDIDDLEMEYELLKDFRTLPMPMKAKFMSCFKEYLQANQPCITPKGPWDN